MFGSIAQHILEAHSIDLKNTTLPINRIGFDSPVLPHRPYPLNARERPRSIGHRNAEIGQLPQDARNETFTRAQPVARWRSATLALKQDDAVFLLGQTECCSTARRPSADH